MKKKITQVLSIIVAGSLITTSAVYTDSFNDQKTISPSYYADFCSHLSNQIYREVGSVSISNANLVNSYLANELAGTRFELKEDGSVVAYISDTKWRTIENGVENIIDDKVLTDKVVTITKEVVGDACNDLSSQVSNSAQMVTYCDSAIESINAQFGEQSAEFLLQNDAAKENDGDEEIEDSATNEPITIAQRDEQIESLETMKAEYELKSSNLAAFECYAEDVNLASYVEDDPDCINSLCGELDNTTSEFISDLDAIVNELAESGIDTTQLALACSSFKESANQSVSDVKFSCNNLLSTDMAGADLEQYMQNECADLEIISSNLSDNSILNGYYETSVSSENVSNTDDSTIGTETVEYSDEDIVEIKSALSEIQEQLKLFDEKYGNAIADVSAEVNAITSIMQIMGEGGIYEGYMTSLNSITSELNEKLGELRTTDSTSSINAAIESISELVATYTTNTNETVSNIQSSVDGAISSIKGNTMNMDAFSEYQGYIINLASSSSDSISSLQTSIETEAAERKTADEKLSQSIGTIRSDIMYLIGSKSISNVGSSITAAIGNTSLAGIGDGTISGAISSLNNSLATHSTKDLIYFYTVYSAKLTTSVVGSYEINLNLTYKAGYTPFFLSCNFIGATGLSINSVNISSDKKTASIWYNVERNESRNFTISLTYFLIKNAR